MALTDLVATKSAMTEEAIEEIVREHVRYDPDEREIAFTPEFSELSNKAKVLVYLVAVQGWSFVLDEPISVAAKPADLEERLGIPGGTLRPILKDLKDRHLIASKSDGYVVRPSGLPGIKKELTGPRPASDSRKRKPVRRAKSGSKQDDLSARSKDRVTDEASDGATQKKRKASGSREIKSVFNSWIENGFFDQPRTLADVQSRFHEEAIIIPQTSIPKYLLGAVRDRSLTRRKQEVNGKSRWVYERKTS